MREINIKNREFTDKSWERFTKKIAIAEYGDPMMTLRSLDEALKKQGREIVILDAGLSDLPFFIGVRKGYHKEKMSKKVARTSS